jgi:hypothetical protein
MTAYNLRDENAVGDVDVQFSPLATPMVAWYAWLSDDGEERTEQRPVLGVLVRHGVNAEGEVIGSNVQMAVQLEDTGDLCTADDRLLLGTNEEFVGVYPAGMDAPAEAISNTLWHLQRKQAQKKSG